MQVFHNLLALHSYFICAEDFWIPYYLKHNSGLIYYVLCFLQCVVVGVVHVTAGKEFCDTWAKGSCKAIEVRILSISIQLSTTWKLGIILIVFSISTAL